MSAQPDPGYPSDAGKVEPVCWWGLPTKLAQEYIHSYNFERIVRLTAGNGCYALAGCLTRTPGLYSCHTESHRQALRHHTINALFLMKQDPNESVYDPALVSLLESVTTPKTTSKTAPTKDTKVVTPDSKS